MTNEERRDSIRRLARVEYAAPSDGRIEIDRDALLSDADHGVWVAAWVWLGYDTLPPDVRLDDEPATKD